MSHNPRQLELKEIRNGEIVKLYPDLTMEELGKKFGLTKGRVSQIIKKYKNNVKRT